MPWHHRHAQADAQKDAPATASLPASSASVVAPPQGLRLRLPPTTSPALSSPEHDAPATGPYAPLTETEWRELFQAYRWLAQCEDHYMHSAGLEHGDVARRLVAMGKADALRADALRLLDPQSPLQAAWRQPADADGQAARVDQTLAALMADAPERLGRALARKATARYYVAAIAGDVCRPDPRYRELMIKAGQ
jgi:hypothetical protein